MIVEHSIQRATSNIEVWYRFTLDFRTPRAGPTGGARRKLAKNSFIATGETIFTVKTSTFDHTWKTFDCNGNQRFFSLFSSGNISHFISESAPWSVREAEQISSIIKIVNRLNPVKNTSIYVVPFSYWHTICGVSINSLALRFFDTTDNIGSNHLDYKIR